MYEEYVVWCSQQVPMVPPRKLADFDREFKRASGCQVVRMDGKFHYVGVIPKRLAANTAPYKFLREFNSGGTSSVVLFTKSAA